MMAFACSFGGPGGRALPVPEPDGEVEAIDEAAPDEEDTDEPGVAELHGFADEVLLVGERSGAKNSLL
ncbi:hypothetical protein [Sorangium sp. So ce145]|uniref:hypothetical protein n=1 Tax=Sorangium sp. So ce145 TaxID=3133285 RepID=UPI003F61EDBB